MYQFFKLLSRKKDVDMDNRLFNFEKSIKSPICQMLTIEHIDHG